MSFIFRAYHAMARQRPMSTRTGIPTAATYVFVNMLQKLRKDFAPEYLAAVYDVAGPTFRDTKGAEVASIRKFDIKTQQFTEVAYGGYKANRSETPPDLQQQFPYIRRALEAYRIPILENAGYEADDVIGTLARLGADEGYPVYVVSSDKDMLQLVNDRVCVLNPPKDNLICDAAKVEEILGVPPERVVDVMALRGDSIDNVPGAPGIGDKGSVEIIRRFGSLEAALDHAAEVERKTYRESLQGHREQILYSKEQVTIDRFVPGVDLNVDAMKTREPDATAARALFTELEFTTLAKDFAPTVEIGETHYTEAATAGDLERILKQVSGDRPLAVAFPSADDQVAEVEEEETETAEEPAADSGSLPLIPSSLVGAESSAETGSLFQSKSESTSDSGGEGAGATNVAISAKPGEAAAVELSSAAAAPLRAALADAKLPKAIHDYKAALRFLANAASGMALAGVRDDSLLYSYLLDPTYSSHSLEAVALRRFNLPLSGSAAQRADLTGRLAALLGNEVSDDAVLRRVYDEIDFPLVAVLARMEATGVKLDCDVLAKMSRRLEAEVSEKAKAIYQLAGSTFNINSPRQLADVLFIQMNLPRPVKYGRGKTMSTAADVLQQLATEHEVPRLVLEYRELSKLKSTYVDALPQLCRPETGRLHTTFNQAGTATGRLSSTNPNLQNIPIRTELGREIRAAFIAEPNHVLLAADYSQIELRLLAHFSEDPLLVEAFRRGDDIHSLTASEVFGVPPMLLDAEHRRRAKAVNFGIVYGLSAFGLSQQIGIEQKEAKQFIERYFERYAGVRRFIDQTLDKVRREGRVRTLFGRVRPIPDINSRNPNMRGFAERTAVNTPLQGTAADLIKVAMIRIDAELARRNLRTRMTLQVHDELVFEVPQAEVEGVRALVTEQMESAHQLRVPLKVEVGVGPNWRDLD